MACPALAVRAQCTATRSLDRQEPFCEKSRQKSGLQQKTSVWVIYNKRLLRAVVVNVMFAKLSW